MINKRSYSDGCAAAHALDLVGERWALLIVRELLLGPKRFTDIRSDLGAISSNVLTQRLTELEHGLVLHRRKLPPPASVWVYELTEWGRQLEPAILELVRWGLLSPAFCRGAPIGIDALVLSFKALANVHAVRSATLCIELEFDTQIFYVEALHGALRVGRGNIPGAQVRVTTDTGTLLKLVYGKDDPETALGSGMLRLDGDPMALQAFFDLFCLPRAVAAPGIAAEMD